MPSITDLPLEVILDDFLPLLSIPDLLSLTCTGRYFAKVCNDDTFWKRKLYEDYNFSGRSARATGFKLLYRGLRRPRVFVWGQSGQGRLGLGKNVPRASGAAVIGGVPYPVELNVGDSGIVDMVAGGWSFTALDSRGRLYVWGQLADGFPLVMDGFSNSAKMADTPHRLELPVKIKTMSCGRGFSVALDSTSQVWGFQSWGRPYRLSTPFFDHTRVHSRVVNVDAGWTFACALTQTGEAYIWAPDAGVVKQRVDENDIAMDAQQLFAHSQDGVIPCATWTLTFDPLPLPALPQLPKLKPDATEHPHLVKLAAGDQFLIGLTNGGHVLKIDLDGIDGVDGLDMLKRLFERRARQWQYLPFFSEVDRIKTHPVFAANSASTAGAPGLAPPQQMDITHISANFHTFVAYSTGPSSMVLMGTENTREDTLPTMPRTLQYKSVISVVLGDYHQAALTSDGQLLTWGGYSAGAIGLGDPLQLEPGAPGGFKDLDERERAYTRRLTPANVAEPTPVRFDHGLKKGKERFCFAAAAGGWHTGALVIDLDDEPEEREPLQEAPSAHHPLPEHGTSSHPGGIMRLHRGVPFRVGYAGRGLGGPNGRARGGRGLFFGPGLPDA